VPTGRLRSLEKAAAEADAQAKAMRAKIAELNL